MAKLTPYGDFELYTWTSRVKTSSSTRERKFQGERIERFPSTNTTIFSLDKRMDHMYEGAGSADRSRSRRAGWASSSCFRVLILLILPSKG